MSSGKQILRPMVEPHMDHLSEQLFELQGRKMEDGFLLTKDWKLLAAYESFFIVQKPLRRSQFV